MLAECGFGNDWYLSSHFEGKICVSWTYRFGIKITNGNNKFHKLVQS